MIHDEICSFEVCKLAKEKGFNESLETDRLINDTEDTKS